MDMNTNDRLAMLENALEKERIQQELEDQKKLKEQNRLFEQILALGPQIEELIKLGNAVLHAGKMPYVDSLYEEDNMDKVFIANGWSHRVGFMGRPNKQEDTIYHVGFYSGGACGPWNLFVNQNEEFERHEDTKKMRIPSIEHMQKFINEFDDFEKRFYIWFDKTFGE